MLLKLNETTIEITDQVLLILKKYVQDKGQNESGGILLGGYIPSENKYDFVAVSEPCSSDQSGPAYFIRNKENAQRVINQHWRNSRGRINYLGEWHTHGCERPYPSYTDRNLLKMIIKDKSNIWPEVFMLIVGRKNTFYLGMADAKNKGEIVSEKIIEEE